MASRPDATWEQLGELIQASACRHRAAVDVERVLRALAGAVRAFQRRQGQPAQPSADVRRRRLRRVVAGLGAVARDLGAIGGSRHEAGAWIEVLEEIRGRAERALEEAERPARPGVRRDEATHRLVLEVAWVLGREGLPIATQADSLLARCVRAAAARAGRRLPDDARALCRLLAPAVRFVARGRIPPPEKPNSTLPRPARNPYPVVH